MSNNSDKFEQSSNSHKIRDKNSENPEINSAFSESISDSMTQVSSNGRDPRPTQSISDTNQSSENRIDEDFQADKITKGIAEISLKDQPESLSEDLINPLGDDSVNSSLENQYFDAHQGNETYAASIPEELELDLHDLSICYVVVEAQSLDLAQLEWALAPYHSMRLQEFSESERVVLADLNLYTIKNHYIERIEQTFGLYGHLFDRMIRLVYVENDDLKPDKADTKQELNVQRMRQFEVKSFIHKNLLFCMLLVFIQRTNFMHFATSNAGKDGVINENLMQVLKQHNPILFSLISPEISYENNLLKSSFNFEGVGYLVRGIIDCARQPDAEKAQSKIRSLLSTRNVENDSSWIELNLGDYVFATNPESQMDQSEVSDGKSSLDFVSRLNILLENSFHYCHSPCQTYNIPDTKSLKKPEPIVKGRKFIRDFAYHPSMPEHWGRYELKPYPDDNEMSPEKDEETSHIWDCAKDRWTYSLSFIENPLDKSKLSPRCRAEYDFEPEDLAELPLRIGDVVDILYDRGDGWLVGINSESGLSGLVPGNHVKYI